VKDIFGEFSSSYPAILGEIEDRSFYWVVPIDRQSAFMIFESSNGPSVMNIEDIELLEYRQIGIPIRKIQEELNQPRIGGKHQAIRVAILEVLFKNPRIKI
jgi:hypothetical protein